MKIDFSYNKKDINPNSGYIFKGKHYRCSFIRFQTLYENPEPGTETVELYNFEPKSDIRASLMILHGLGISNIKFLLWMGKQLASAGINTFLPILPGIYTRVENGFASGVSYLYPYIPRIYKCWEHAIVDIFSIIDFLDQNNLWKQNNCLFGYCLGGMISSIISVMDPRIYQTVFMTTGGHLPRIIFESTATRFARKIIYSGKKHDYFLADKKMLYRIYDEQLASVKKMSLHEILNNEEIHPFFRIDPLSYAHLLNQSRAVFIDALFDHSLPFQSRSLLYKEMTGAKRYIVPIGHTSWLPFEYLLARYIAHKVHVDGKNVAKRLIKREVIEDPMDDYSLKDR